MAKLILGVIVALSLSFSAVTAMASETRLPLAKDGEISSPTVLADRIKEALKGSNPNVDKVVRGANATARDFIRAIEHVDPSVNTYPKFDAYLRSLKECPIPQGRLALSEIDMVNGKPTLDLTEGSHRFAEPKELAWCTPDGAFVLAGKCMNTNIIRPVNLQWKESKKRAVFVPPTCPLIITLMVYDSSGVNVEGVAEQLGDKTGGRRVSGAKSGSTDGDGSEDYRVSRAKGALLQAQATLDKVGDKVTVVRTRGDKESLVFEGTIVGSQVVKLPTDFNKETDKIIIYPTVPEKFVSPSRHGLIIWGTELRDCGTNKASLIKS